MTELPTTFGKYFLTEKLATGGMAEIYLAKLVGPGGFEKQLVIKQIHPRLTGERHFVDLFVAEAKTLVTLAHGNIVPVYELGVLEDRYFIAMEYIDGPTLYRLTETLARRDARMDPALAAWIAAKILEGLDYAHRKGEGVIHRDLSPRNVMLSRDGEVKLVDFGIAVTLGAVDVDSDVQSAPTGSFPYMSPEQVRREPLSGQTDLFSAGVLLWEMLAGTRLFARPDPDATLAAVTDGSIERPSQVREDVPAKLDEVVMRALERDQTARWASAGDMLAALQRYLYSLEETPGPRDVAALVARFCPPETRRLPTHADPPDADAAPRPAGPHTAVIPRDGEARGKRARTETFATHVDLKQILERATPLFPISAITDEPETHVRAPTGERAAEPKPLPHEPVVDEPDDAAEPDAAPKSSMRMQRVSDAEDDPRARIIAGPSQRSAMQIAAIGAIILGFLAVYVFWKGRAAVLHPDAAPRSDLAWYVYGPEGGSDPVDAPADALEDAADPAVVDGAPTIAPDARASDPPRDAGRIAKPDADVGTPPPDAAATAGSAKLVIGANPWGEIVIDGVVRGRTPKTLDVSAGKHVVKIIYRGEDPPLEKTFAITVKDGEQLPLQADFKN